MGKKYTSRKKTGNKGSAYIEYLMTDFCLMHKIDEAKDIGTDYLCEWIFGENPSGILFLSQIKTRSAKTEKQEIKIKEINRRSRLNLLSEVRISGAACTIDEDTMEYWRGLGIPVFLFLLVDDSGYYRCFYKRFTPILHSGKNQGDENFYEVRDGEKFLAFQNMGGKRVGGFARDLFIDYIRCNYKKGSLMYKNPRDLGLEQFPEDERTRFAEFLEEYKDEINANISKLGLKIDANGNGTSMSASSSSSSNPDAYTTMPPEDDEDDI